MKQLIWADPWLLALVLPLTLVALMGWRRHRSPPTLAYSQLSRLTGAPPSRSARARSWLAGLRWASLALLVAALARPQLAERLTQASSEGIEIVVALDTSGSMRGLDLDTTQPIPARRNRLMVAKEVVARFAAGRSNDALGLVVFGEQAFTQCPLTLDHGVFRGLLDKVEIGVAGDATALGAGLATAVKRLSGTRARSKVVILVTDGRNNGGVLAPVEAAETARALGIRVYTVGVGSVGKAPFLVPTPFGEQVVYHDVDLDSETLAEIARRTGGAFFRAQDARTLGEIWERIDRLEKSELVTFSRLETEERFGWLVLPALGLLLVEIALATTRLATLP
ncbi:MAG TPA: VWA domain-containing protein [Thermoanaerobaculia bacterium]|nr:VWA domain-containing protein [Thermoanaerobaculia bacterium]